MPIYSQVTYLPILFKLESGSLAKLPGFLEEKNLFFKEVLLVSGETFSSRLAQTILSHPSASDWRHLTVSSHAVSEVERIRAQVEGKPVDLIVGVGGGKVLDVVKRLSLLQRINHVAVPTIISNDGLVSPISVLRLREGRTESIAGQMPMGVIVDLDILRETPRKFLQAAAGDILSNHSATLDWKLASDHRGEQINDIAFQMALMAVHSTINFTNLSLASIDFLHQVIYGQFNSGIAMALAGTSRPCSGSEHLISHAIDYLHLSDHTLHGLQVGSISIFSLHLQRELQPQHIRYAQCLGIPVAFGDLSPTIKDNLQRVFEVARTMRPGRFTVLDIYSNQELLLKYREFEQILKEYTCREVSQAV